MKSKSTTVGRLSFGLMALLAMHGLSACGDTTSGGGDGDGDGDAASGGNPSTGGAASGGESSTGGISPGAGGGLPAGGAASGGMNQGGEGGMGGAGTGGDFISGAGGLVLMPCPEGLPNPPGECEPGDAFSCQHPLYGFVTPSCRCSGSSWNCLL